MIDLAMAAHLSVSTIKRAEDDRTEAVDDGAFASVRNALEAAGIQFLDNEGSGIGLRLKAKPSEKPSSLTMTNVAFPT